VIRNRFVLLVLCLLLATLTFAQSPTPPALHRYGNLPLAFEANHGQVDARAQFVARGSGYSLFLAGDESVLRLGTKHGAVLRTQLVGARQVVPQADQALPGRVNYLIDKDPKNWVTNVPTYARVRYAGAYPGIDLLYYGKQGRLEYDFVVAPGADARQIRMRVAGTDKLSIAKDGSLVITSGGMKVKWAAPVAYEQSAVSHQPSGKTVAVSYRVRGNEISFIVGPHDRARELVIDPALVYSTYLGGSVNGNPFDQPQPAGSAFNQAAGVAVDASGNAYVAGVTNANDFPVTSGSYDPTNTASGCSPHSQCLEGFITKLNASGSALVYSTYFGNPDSLNALAIDGTGRAYVIGTFAPGGGGVPITSNAFQTTSPICDFCGEVGYLSVLSADGASLVYSTIYSENDSSSSMVFPLAIAVGSGGVAYVTGYVGGPNLPLRNAYQTTNNGNEDAFVAKFDPAKSGAASLEYATYLGGTEQDHGEGIATASGQVWVVGFTASTDFPTTASAIKRTLGGATDAFVTHIDTNQIGMASLLWSTQLGGAGIDDAKGVAVLSGAPYVTGFTQSTDFPVTSGATHKTHTTCGSDGNVCDDVFVTKLNSSGSGITYSTYLGGSLRDDPTAIAVDTAGNALITGFTQSADFPTTADALQRTFGGSACGSTGVVTCGDAFLAKVNTTGATMYASYLGGSGGDVGTGIARDTSNNAYVAGYTESGDFPTTSGAFSRTRSGQVDAFLSKFSFAAGTGCSTGGVARTVVICQPVNNSTVTSPVHITAAVHQGASGIQVVQVYVDGAKKFETGPSGLGNADNGDQILNVDIAMSAGTHRITVQAIDASGAFKATVYATVSGSTCATNGTARTVVICQPAANSTVSSPVQISAAAHPGSTATTYLQLYVDGSKKNQVATSTLTKTSSGDYVWNVSQAMTTGTHRVTVQAVDGAGAYKATIYITVK
jgi:hypothetical protein